METENEIDTVKSIVKEVQPKYVIFFDSIYNIVFNILLEIFITSS